MRISLRSSRLPAALISLIALAVLVAPSALAATPVPGASVTYTTDADFDKGTLLNVNHSSPGANQLQVNSQVSTFPFAWIALSARGTIAKVDTATGNITGEYKTAPDGMGGNPSRTTVDDYGNVWVGNRAEASGGQGSVARIGLKEANQCIDRNNNGSIETSTGLGDIKAWTGSGAINGAADECVINFVRVAGRNVHGTAVNTLNEAWVGGYNGADEHDQTLVRGLADGTGQILKTISPACGGYGNLVNDDGILWSTDAGSNSVLRYNPTTDTAQCIDIGATTSGIAADGAGNVWVTSEVDNTVTKLSPAGVVLFTTFIAGDGARSITVSPVDQNLWVTSSISDSVVRMNAVGDFVASIPVGLFPTGISVDSVGKIWVADRDSNDVKRINPVSNIVDLTKSFGAGAGPDTFTDMTGSVSQLVNPIGSWTVVQDAGVSGSTWNSVTWNTEVQGSTPPGTTITVEVRTSESVSGLGAVAPTVVTNGSTFSKVGRYIEVRAELRGVLSGTALTSPILSDLKVSGTATPVPPTPTGPVNDCLIRTTGAPNTSHFTLVDPKPLVRVDGVVGSPSLRIIVNGDQTQLGGLKIGDVRELKVASSLSSQPTEVTLELSGSPGSEVCVTFSSSNDTTAPTTTATTTGTAGADGWYRGDVSLKLGAADNTSGSGVQSLTYCATGAEKISCTTVPGSSKALTIDAEGVTTVTYYGRDKDGNVEATKTIVVRVDKTAPNCFLSDSGTNWLEWTVQDTRAGLKNIESVSTINTTLAVPTFAAGAITPVMVRSNVTVAAKTSQTAFNAYDQAGNKTLCDPVITPVIAGDNKTVISTVTLPQDLHFVRFSNVVGSPDVIIRVNGKMFTVDDLRVGNTQDLDIAKAMKSGDNVITIETSGRSTNSVRITFYGEGTRDSEEEGVEDRDHRGWSWRWSSYKKWSDDDWKSGWCRPAPDYKRGKPNFRQSSYRDDDRGGRDSNNGHGWDSRDWDRNTDRDRGDDRGWNGWGR